MRQTRFTRRYLLKSAAGLAAVVSSAALLEACSQPAAAPAATSAPAKPAEPAKPAAPAAQPAATTAPATAKPAEPAKPAAGASGKPVSPIAAAGGLNQTTITIIIFSGPEADTHTRLAPKFTEYTQGKVKVQVEEGGRGDAYDAKWLSGMQAKTTAWDVIHDNGPRFLGSGPAGFFQPLAKFMAD